MVVGEPVAVLATEALPVMLPAPEGAKLTFSVAVCPGVRVVPLDTPLALKPAPEILTLDIDTFEVPELVRVTGRVLFVPVFTLPKLRLVGLALSAIVPLLTVSVAALLVTLPVELLTTTVNCAPLSELAVAGVV
jgi:hypothetical protein